MRAHNQMPGSHNKISPKIPPTEELTGPGSALPLALERSSLAADPESSREFLIKEFCIELFGERVVKLKLNGRSRIDFLSQVQVIASELYKRKAIYDSQLDEWKSNTDFTAESTQEIAVCGLVADSTNMTREQQELEGWNDVDLPDLAVAHAAYFLVTGEDLFNNNLVRAREGVLTFYHYGLGVNRHFQTSSCEFVAASKKFDKERTS